MEDTEAVGVIITLLKDKYTIKEENCFCTALNITSQLAFSIKMKNVC